MYVGVLLVGGGFFGIGLEGKKVLAVGDRRLRCESVFALSISCSIREKNVVLVESGIKECE